MAKSLFKVIINGESLRTEIAQVRETLRLVVRKAVRLALGVGVFIKFFPKQKAPEGSVFSWELIAYTREPPKKNFLSILQEVEQLEQNLVRGLSMPRRINWEQIDVMLTTRVRARQDKRQWAK